MKLDKKKKFDKWTIRVYQLTHFHLIIIYVCVLIYDGVILM